MIRNFTFTLLLGMCLLGGAVNIDAASDNFIIRTLIDDDTTPPDIPTGLTATPIATSQIDLSWNPSLDNFILSGYQVFRDDVQIATTTGTVYSDVGLIASTTYAYYVTAFDSFNNVSASSTVVATTTLASTTPPTPTATSTSRTGTRISLEIIRFVIIPAQNSVIIRYETRSAVRSALRWGNTISYELGSIAERSFSKIHETKIMGLQPGTTYKFIIEGEHALGIRGTLTESTFTTLPPDDIIPPGNVTDLRAVKDGDDIVLSWVNPTDPDLARIRVVRSDLFYPGDTADGWVVYDGQGESVRDTGAAEEGARRFYTVFTYDELGNISSGAVVSVRIDGGESTPIPLENETDNPISLRFSDLSFLQDDEPVYVATDQVTIDGAKRLVILLPYARVPEHLKTILVTLTDYEGKEFAFLLRINKDKTGYVAELAPFGIAASYGLRLSVFDFKTAQIGTAHGTVVSEIVHIPEPAHTDTSFISYLVSVLMKYGGYFLAFIVFLLLILYLSKRLMKNRG